MRPSKVDCLTSIIITVHVYLLMVSLSPMAFAKFIVKLRLGNRVTISRCEGVYYIDDSANFMCAVCL